MFWGTQRGQQVMTTSITGYENYHLDASSKKIATVICQTGTPDWTRTSTNLLVKQGP